MAKIELTEGVMEMAETKSEALCRICGTQEFRDGIMLHAINHEFQPELPAEPAAQPGIHKFTPVRGNPDLCEICGKNFYGESTGPVAHPDEDRKEVMPNEPRIRPASKSSISDLTGDRLQGSEVSGPVSGLSDPCKLAYLAGLIDGEGTVRIEKKMSPVKKGMNPGYEAHVTIHNTSAMLAAWIVTNFPEANKIRCQQRRSPWKPIYRITWLCMAAENLCRAAMPFLVIKKRQAEILLELRGITKHEGFKGRFSDQEIAERQRLFERCKSFNSGPERR